MTETDYNGKTNRLFYLTFHREEKRKDPLKHILILKIKEGPNFLQEIL